MLFKAENLRAFSHKLWGPLIPALIWAGLFLSRRFFYHPWCAVTPTPCTSDQVNSFDQWAFHFNDIRYDFWSTVLQNSVAVLLFAMPFILYRRRYILRALEEAWLMLLITLWNGAGLEIMRSIVQRPRPLVYHSPMDDGSNINQYTSFYSGHTSFVAAATLSIYFMVCRRFPNQKWIHLNFFAVFICLSVLCGSLRVMGGRHYPTDVIFGFLFGCGFALLWNRRPPLEYQNS